MTWSTSSSLPHGQYANSERKDPGRNIVAILGVETPARQGARSEHTGGGSDEQRGPAGCIGGQGGNPISIRVLSAALERHP
jgi:hypothetical protein